MVYISHRWRKPRFILALFVLELAFTIPALALFAIAEDDTYRTKLWQDGFNNGFNSSPAQPLYDYANRRPVHYPLVWSNTVTSFNVVISILSTFMLLVKAVLFVMHIWVPLLSAIVHAALVILWSFSVYAQSASDMTDPKHPQRGAPWYITKSCSVVFNKNNIHYCRQAKAAFAVSIILLLLFITNTIWAAYSTYPSKEERRRKQMAKDEDQLQQASVGGMVQASDGSWELREFPPPPTQANKKGVKRSVKSMMSKSSKSSTFSESWEASELKV